MVTSLHLFDYIIFYPFLDPHSRLDYVRHIGRSMTVPHFLHEPFTPAILQRSRYFAAIHLPSKEAHQCSPAPSALIIIEHFLLA